MFRSSWNASWSNLWNTLWTSDQEHESTIRFAWWEAVSLIPAKSSAPGATQAFVNQPAVVVAPSISFSLQILPSLSLLIPHVSASGCCLLSYNDFLEPRQTQRFDCLKCFDSSTLENIASSKLSLLRRSLLLTVLRKYT